MRFTLTIDGDTNDADFSKLAGLFGSAAVVTSIAAAAPTPAAEPAKPGRKKAEPAPTPEPVAQPTPGGTDAPPAESIPPNQGAAVDPFAAAPAAVSDPSTAATAGSATSASQPTAAAGEITYDMLKDAMTELLGRSSAASAQQTLKDATGGVASLTALKPEQYAAAHAALAAAHR